MPNLANPFGNTRGREWSDLRRIVERSLRNHFFNASEDDIEDAASDAICRLVEYWAGLPSSLTSDTERNWNYACLYARRYAAMLLHRELKRQTGSILFSTPTTYGSDGGSDHQQTVGDWVETLEWQGDGRLTDAEYDSRVDEFFSLLSEEDLAEFRPTAEGKTLEQTAKKRGTSRQAVQQRQSRRRNKLAIVAKRCGLKVA